jgi:hypothetical protein
MSSDKWLNCRLRDIQARLCALKHSVSLPVLSRLLKNRDYLLRVNVKEHEGAIPADRDAQFVYLLEVRKQHQQAGQPVLSVDTKKKELVGNFKNAGQVWCTSAERVNVHDFPS